MSLWQRISSLRHDGTIIFVRVPYYSFTPLTCSLGATFLRYGHQAENWKGLASIETPICDKTVYLTAPDAPKDALLLPAPCLPLTIVPPKRAQFLYIYADSYHNDVREPLPSRLRRKAPLLPLSRGALPICTMPRISLFCPLHSVNFYAASSSASSFQTSPNREPCQSSPLSISASFAVSVSKQTFTLTFLCVRDKIMI